MAQSIADRIKSSVTAPPVPEPTGPSLEDKTKAANLYGGTPDAPAKAPNGFTDPVGDSTPYSFVKAAAFLSRKRAGNNSKVEVHMSDRLKSVYSHMSDDPDCLAVPLSPRFLVDDIEGIPIPGMKSLKQEIYQHLNEGVAGGVDMDFLRWMRRKSIGQKALTTLFDADGGALVPPSPLGDIIELQMNAEAFSQAGATQVALNPNNRLNMPKVLSGATGGFIGEAQTMTDSQQKMGHLEMVGRKLYALVQMTSDLLRFTNSTVEALIRNDMAAQSAQTADKSMFNGVGGVEFTGLLLYPSTTEPFTQNRDRIVIHTARTTGSNGDTFRPADPGLMVHKLPDGVIGRDGVAYLINPLLSEFVLNSRADSITANDGAGPFLFNLNRDPQTGVTDRLNGCRVVRSSNLPRNRVKGTGTNLTAVVCGYFPDWIIARMGVGEFRRFDGYNASVFNDMVALRLIQYIDAAPRHAASFVVCDNLLIPS